MNNKSIEYFEVTHSGHCVECDSTVGSYGCYSTYEKAKARFDRVVSHYVDDEQEEPTERGEDYFRVGDDRVGYEVAIERKTLRLDADIDMFGI